LLIIVNGLEAATTNHICSTWDWAFSTLSSLERYR